MGNLWEHCKSLNDLRRLLSIFEQTHQIDVMKKAPPALLAVKFEPAKPPTPVPRGGAQKQPGRPKNGDKKGESKAKSPPARPSQTNPPPAS